MEELKQLRKLVTKFERAYDKSKDLWTKSRKDLEYSKAYDKEREAMQYVFEMCTLIRVLKERLDKEKYK